MSNTKLQNFKSKLNTLRQQRNQRQSFDKLQLQQKYAYIYDDITDRFLEKLEEVIANHQNNVNQKRTQVQIIYEQIFAEKEDSKMMKHVSNLNENLLDNYGKYFEHYMKVLNTTKDQNNSRGIKIMEKRKLISKNFQSFDHQKSKQKSTKKESKIKVNKQKSTITFFVPKYVKGQTLRVEYVLEYNKEKNKFSFIGELPKKISDIINEINFHRDIGRFYESLQYYTNQDEEISFYQN